jgi:hypothetical protein
MSGTFWTCVALLVAAIGVAVIWSALVDDQRRRRMTREIDQYRTAADADPTGDAEQPRAVERDSEPTRRSNRGA